MLLRTWHLANGLTIEILDDTVSYYGDYSTVKLVIRCEIEVKKEYVRPLNGHPRYTQVTEALGDAVEYRREITKPGVSAGNLAAMRAFLIESFEENALGYFEREDFPERYVRKQFTDMAEDLAKKDRFTDGDR